MYIHISICMFLQQSLLSERQVSPVALKRKTGFEPRANLQILPWEIAFNLYQEILIEEGSLNLYN